MRAIIKSHSQWALIILRQLLARLLLSQVACAISQLLLPARENWGQVAIYKRLESQLGPHLLLDFGLCSFFDFFV
jgi:hypothetical protein